MEPLTIITVNYLAKPYIEFQHSLIRRYSPDLIFKYVVVDNSPEPEVLDIPYLYIKKAEYTLKEDKFINYASFSHAAALDKALPQIHTRFALITDPDFFLMVNIPQVLEYMQQEKISVYGSPYVVDPTKKKVYGVPVAFNMFVDTKLVDISKWTFTPSGVREDGILGDTGVAVYESIRDNCKYEATIPYESGAADLYAWIPPGETKHKLYGVHCRAKLHLRKDDQNKLRDRIDSQLKNARRIIGG